MFTEVSIQEVTLTQETGEVKIARVHSQTTRRKTAIFNIPMIIANIQIAM
jgi:hypothetical protein